MTDLGRNERRLLEALGQTEAPSTDDRVRVRAKVLTRIAAAGGVSALAAKAAAAAPGTAGATTASVAPPAMGVAIGSWKVASAIVVLVGAAGGGAWIATTSNRMDERTPSTAHAVSGVPNTEAAKAPRSEEPDEPPSTKPLGPALTAPRPQPRKRTVRPPERKADPAGLESELSLLEQAQRSLKEGDAESALASLERHASDHPDGVLASERQGVLAIALCQADHQAEGQRAARRFLAESPTSPMAARVRAACLDKAK
jgi:type IV secretory pathway VirB10-like protein